MIAKIMFWNVQGLGTSRSRLRSLLRKHKPKILIMAEHFRNESKLLHWQHILRFDKCFLNGIKKGKLWIFWEKVVNVSVLDFSNQQILLSIDSSSVVTAIYEKCLYLERRCLWYEILSFSALQLPWIILGDLNIILDDSKRRGGNPSLHCAMEDFCTFIDARGFINLSFSGNKFSWCNGQGVWRVVGLDWIVGLDEVWPRLLQVPTNVDIS